MMLSKFACFDNDFDDNTTTKAIYFGLRENKINVDQCIVVIGNTYSLSCTGSKCEFSIIQQLRTSLLIY